MSNQLTWQVHLNGEWHSISAREAAIFALQLSHPIRLAQAACIRVSTR